MKFTLRTIMLMTLMSSISLALYATQGGLLDISQDEIIDVPNNSFASELAGSILNQRGNLPNQTLRNSPEQYRTLNSPSSPSKKKLHFGIKFPDKKEIEIFLEQGNYTKFNFNYGIVNLTNQGLSYQKFLTLINKIVRKELEIFAVTSPSKNQDKINREILIHKMATFNKVIKLIVYLLSCDEIHSTLFSSKVIYNLEKSHFTKNELEALSSLERLMIQ